MANTGEDLENFVARIEREFLPEGFTVDTRVKQYSDGVQLAEFDIRIAGTIGTVEYCCIIECRDRPGSGPEGADWVQQMIGRREQFRPNKIIAVSSTGFTEPARRSAAQAGIELRHVQQIDLATPAEWIGSLPQIHLHHTERTLRNINLHVREPDNDRHAAIVGAMPEKVGLSNLETEVGEEYNFLELASFAWNAPGKKENFATGEIFSRRLVLRGDAPLFFRTGVGPVQVSALDFTWEIEVHDRPLSLLAAKEYLRTLEGDRVVQLASYEPIDIGFGQQAVLELLRSGDDRGYKVQLRIL